MNLLNKRSCLFLFLFFILTLSSVSFTENQDNETVVYEDYRDLKDGESQKVIVKDIERGIDEIISEHPSLHVGVEVYSVKRGQVIYSRNQDELFIPASNTKLFSSLLAFDVLGSNFQFETVILTDGAVKGSCVDGNLYIVGAGDPSLTAQDLRILIKNLKRQGIKTIKGNFCIDNDIFDHEGFAPGTTIDCLGQSWFSLVESMIVDRKAIRAGAREIDFVIGKGKFANNIFDAREFFRRLLIANEIKLTGRVVFKRMPDNKNNQKIVLRHKSKKLIELVEQVLKDSDNLYADCIFKRVGAAKCGFPGTWNKGAKALKDFLSSEVGIPKRGFKVVDGSGLSRYNLVSPHQIVGLLSWAYDQPFFSSFAKILPISGVDGTLKNRMANIAHKVRAKTGTLGGVSALSGYIKTGDDILIFSILNNGYVCKSVSTPPCKLEIEDAICTLLACNCA